MSVISTVLKLIDDLLEDEGWCERDSVLRELENEISKRLEPSDEEVDYLQGR